MFFSYKIQLLNTIKSKCPPLKKAVKMVKAWYMNDDSNVVSQFEPNYLGDVSISELNQKTGVTYHDVTHTTRSLSLSAIIAIKSNSHYFSVGHSRSTWTG